MYVFFIFIINCWLYHKLPLRDIEVTLIKVVAETSALQHVDFVKNFFLLINSSGLQQ